MRFWCSWHQPGADNRPLTYPPNAAIVGWWCSGERGDGESTLCAVVDVDQEADVEPAVLQDWPEAHEWRFIEAKDDKWLPSSGRFPLSDWMKARAS